MSLALIPVVPYPKPRVRGTLFSLACARIFILRKERFVKRYLCSPTSVLYVGTSRASNTPARSPRVVQGPIALAQNLG